MISFPFTSQVSYDTDGMPIYDRAADSAVLRGVIRRYFSTGVFGSPSSGLQVTAGDGMSVVVLPGAFNIEGVTGWEDTNRSMAIEAADTLDRIDLVVLRLDDSINARSVDLYIVKGTAASTPVVPELTRNSTVHELCLAQLYIPANSTGITTARITDTRLNTEVCGTVGYQLGAWSADPYFAQIEALIEDLETAIGGVLDGSEYMLKTQYDPNHHGIDVTTQQYDCVSDGSIHALSGSGGNIKFIADALFKDGDTFTVNGTAVTAQTQDGEELSDGFFEAGAVVSCFLNDGVLHFISGGKAGLTLLWKNASPSGAFPAQELPIAWSGYGEYLKKQSAKDEGWLKG